jgi:hypothetical protein
MNVVADAVPMRQRGVPLLSTLPLNWTKAESFSQWFCAALPRSHRR